MAQFTVDSSDHAPSLLAGRYLLGAEVGRGGMAVVYRAWDSLLNRDVAVKMLRGVLLDPTARDRFTAEGRTLARLSHPGLTMMFDAGTQGDSPYLVMELVDGQTLGEHYRQYHVDAEQVCAIGAELADALAYVHRCGIVHRDVKPSNILLGHDGRVRLADFGIARMVADAGKQTATGLTMGTAAYLSPEQVREERITGASDVYALGLVLLESLTGQPAFSGPQNVVALARLMSPPRIDESIPPALRELLTQMTLNRPEGRPGAAEVAGRLRAMAAGGPALEALQVPVRKPVPVQAPTQPIPRAAFVGAGGAPGAPGGAGSGDSGAGAGGSAWSGGAAVPSSGTDGSADPQAGWVGMRPVPRPRRSSTALLLAVVLAVSVVPLWLLASRLAHHPLPAGNSPASSLALPDTADAPAKADAGAPRVSTKKPGRVEVLQAIQQAPTKTTAPSAVTATAPTTLPTSTLSTSSLPTSSLPTSGLPTSSPPIDPAASATNSPAASPTKPTLAQIIEWLRQQRQQHQQRHRGRHWHKPGKP